MRIAAPLATAMALSIAGAAQAATSFEPIDPALPFHARIDVAPIPLEAFTHRYGFDLSAPSSITATVDFDRQMGVSGGAPYLLLDVAGASVALFRSPDSVLGDGNDVQLSSLVLTNSDEPTWPFYFWEGHTTMTLPPLVLDAGSNYYLQVSGSVGGTNGGRYDIDVSISAVPETRSAGLMLGGLALLWPLLRRRLPVQQGSSSC